MNVHSARAPENKIPVGQWHQNKFEEGFEREGVRSNWSEVNPNRWFGHKLCGWSTAISVHL